jgi:HK97 family phage major capsid protein
MSKNWGLIDQIQSLLSRGVCIPDDRIGILQERIARENQVAGLQPYEPIGASMHVPFSVLNQRDLTVGSAGSNSGGAVVQTTVQPEFAAFLQPFSACVKLGATVLDGLKGNVEIPVARAGVPLAWNAELAPAAESDPQLGSVSLSPKNVTASITVSRQLLVQSVGAEAWVKKELAQAFATELDRIALLGSGASGQALGILNTATAQSVTFGAAATWAKVVSFEQLAGQANAIRENCAWIVGTATRSKWKQALKGTSGAIGYIMDSDHTVNGYRAEATSKLDSTNQVVYGDFSELYIGTWGADALGLTIDGVTQARTGKVVITANCFCDAVLRRPNVFVASTDSGAQ